MSRIVVDCDTHFGVLPYRDQDVSLEKLLSTMDAYGIAAALTYSLKGKMYDFEEGNDETLAACKANPRLLPVMTVDPRRYIGVVEEIEKRKKQGFVALRVFPDSHQAWRIDSPMFRSVIKELERVGMLLVVPCPESPEDILKAVRGTSMPVILCGIGYHNLADAIAACKEHPSLYIEENIIDPPDALAVGVDAIGADRFVFGSNAPSSSMRGSLNLVAESFLNEEDKAKVFGGSICRILGIPMPTVPALNLDAPFADFPIIDIHSHYGKWPFPLRGRGVDFTLDLMKRRGINRTIMSSSLSIVYDFTAGNKQMADAIEGHPELLGYVTVNPNYFDASCRELEKYFKKPNFVGAKMHPMYNRLDGNSRQTRKLAQKIAEYGKPLLIHTFGRGEPAKMFELARDCPNLKIIMGHAGGDDWRGAVEVLRQTPNTYMEFCATVHETDKVRRSVDAVGADRIMFGTDLDLINPAFTAGVYEESSLTTDEKERILYKNAMELFGIEV